MTATTKTPKTKRAFAPDPPKQVFRDSKRLSPEARKMAAELKKMRAENVRLRCQLAELKNERGIR